MTSLGKIFVVVITAFSLLLLGVSTVVLTTATDWRAEIKKLDTEKSRLQPLMTAAQASENDAKSRYETAKKERAGVILPYRQASTLNRLQSDADNRQPDTTRGKRTVPSIQGLSADSGGGRCGARRERRFFYRPACDS